MMKRTNAAAAALLLLWAGQGQVQAANIYATELGNNEIVLVNTVTNAITPVAAASGPDSLIFTPAGNILYTNVFAGGISLYNVSTSTTTALANGLNIPQDLT